MGRKALFYGIVITLFFAVALIAAYVYLGGNPENLYKKPAKSGISGTVLIGPQCPVVRQGMDEQCDDKPYEADIVVKTEDGSKEITRFRSGKDGKFRVPLPSGAYLIDPAPGGQIYPRGTPQTVQVNSNRFTEITVYYDTGIR